MISKKLKIDKFSFLTFLFRLSKAPQQQKRVRGTSISKAPAAVAPAPNQFTREPLSARQSWGQPAYPASGNSTPLYSPAVQPVAPLNTFTPAPQLSAYQHGIHNPVVEDISSFNPPVPHFDHGKNNINTERWSSGKND